MWLRLLRGEFKASQAAFCPSLDATPGSHVSTWIDSTQVRDCLTSQRQ